MSAGTSIAGDASNGTTGTAAFTFYVGPVGICERDGICEVAFFAPPVKPDLPSEGLLDGQKVIVTGVRTRSFNPGERTRSSDATPRVIIATVMPSLTA